MHISFTSHSSDFGNSSKGILEYLEKENSQRDKVFEDLIEDISELEAHNYDEQLQSQNCFFSNRESEDGKELFFNSEEATELIDNNVSSRHTDKQSAFFMINVSPSKDELEHMKNLVDDHLSRNGFDNDKLQILNGSEEGRKHLEVIRNDLMHQMLREYSRDVMRNYAEQFDRKVYSNPDNLPTQREEMEINRFAKAELERLEIDKRSEEYSVKYQELREQKAKEFGRDVSVRKLTENDLVWFGKVEENRTYKPNDRWVIENKKIQKEIDKIEPTKENLRKIEKLKNTLHRDRATGEIVREGMKKGGDQYHVHIVVSRYDNCQNKRYKTSLSPQANHKKSKVAGKTADVGFNRDSFFLKNEKSFDGRFNYERPIEKSYESFKKQNRGKSVITEKISNELTNRISNQVKSMIVENTGLKELNKLNLKSQVSKELGISIPLSVPKTPADAAMKIVAKAVQAVKGISQGY